MADQDLRNILLGVNIDHVATLRQARGTRYPDPVQAALLAEQAGADLITVHLREDRRHIQERDVERLSEVLVTRMNLELAITEPMLAYAERLRPADCCFVPERRAELTTEGGLDVAAQTEVVAEACARLQAAGIRTALFVDPEPYQIEAAAHAGAGVVEIHTGAYAESTAPGLRRRALERIQAAARHAAAAGLEVHAGHGLHYHNVQPIAAIAEVCELNIGHAIVARAVLSGMAAAVRDMRRLLRAARR